MEIGGNPLQLLEQWRGNPQPKSIGRGVNQLKLRKQCNRRL